MGKKRFARDPLLYIQQPTIRTPEAPMQSNYITSREKKESPVESVQPVEQVKRAKPIQKGSPPMEPPQKKPIKKKNAFHQQLSKPAPKQQPTSKTNTTTELNEEVDDYEEKEQEGREPTKFIDMTLEEKVAYFSDAPSYAPKMRCEIKTAERSYRGVITDAKDDEVFIQVGKRSTSRKIPMADIKEIRMLGF